MFYVDRTDWNQEKKAIYVLASIFSGLIGIGILFTCCYSYQSRISLEGQVIVLEGVYWLECNIPVDEIENLEWKKVIVAKKVYQIKKVKILNEITLDMMGNQYQSVQLLIHFDREMKRENIHLSATFYKKSQTLLERWKQTWKKGGIYE